MKIGVLELQEDIAGQEHYGVCTAALMPLILDCDEDSKYSMQPSDTCE